MNVNSLEFNKLSGLFYKWLSINDLDTSCVRDPVRMARFGAYAMSQLGNLIDCWDVGEFVELQIDSMDMFGEVQN